MLTARAVLGDTLRFASANRKTFAIWTGLQLAISLAVILLLRPQTPIDPADMHAFAAAFVLIFIPLLLFMLMLMAAAFRAALFPDQSRFAYLRLGGDELRLFALGLILCLGLYVVMLALILVVALIGVVVALVIGKAGGIVIGSLIGIGSMLAIVVLLVRLVPAAPLTMMRRKIILGQAWRLTRGHFWPLFRLALLVWLGMVTLYLLVLIIFDWQMLVAMLHAQEPGGQQALLDLQREQMNGFTLRLALNSIVGAVLNVIMVTVHAGTLSIATLRLLDADEPLAEPA